MELDEIVLTYRNLRLQVCTAAI